LTAEEVADFAAFDEAVARYTREAVRRQIEAESP
jgi:hypothetical protein